MAAMRLKRAQREAAEGGRRRPGSSSPGRAERAVSRGRPGDSTGRAVAAAAGREGEEEEVVSPAKVGERNRVTPFHLCLCPASHSTGGGASPRRCRRPGRRCGRSDLRRSGRCKRSRHRSATPRCGPQLFMLVFMLVFMLLFMLLFLKFLALSAL